MSTTAATQQQFLFPVSSLRRMPCKHWQQFPIRRNCADCLENFCDKCGCNVTNYNLELERRTLEYQHEKHFYNFINRRPMNAQCECEPN